MAMTEKEHDLGYHAALVLTPKRQHCCTSNEQLQVKDEKSRAILEQMRIDEEQHAESALDAGGFRFPPRSNSA